MSDIGNLVIQNGSYYSYKLDSGVYIDFSGKYIGTFRYPLRAGRLTFWEFR